MLDTALENILNLFRVDNHIKSNQSTVLNPRDQFLHRRGPFAALVMCDHVPCENSFAVECLVIRLNVLHITGCAQSLNDLNVSWLAHVELIGNVSGYRDAVRFWQKPLSSSVCVGILSGVGSSVSAGTAFGVFRAFCVIVGILALGTLLLQHWDTVNLRVTEEVVVSHLQRLDIIFKALRF